ncbi:MAG: 23S rRNA (guanosine(2251)-2'-O)-methyltransferase RlmB [Alphaproteobacteria bacterium]
MVYYEIDYKYKGKTMWLYGHHAVKAALNNTDRHCQKLVLTKEAGRDLLKAAENRNVPIHTVQKSRDIDAYLPHGSVHQGIALEVSPLPDCYLENIMPELDGLESASLLMLDHVTDPHNIGAILRSASAFGCKGVIVSRDHTPAMSGLIAKIASGAAETVPLVQVTNLSRTIDALQEKGFWSVALDERGEKTLSETNLKGKFLFIVGAEGKGLRRMIKENSDFLARLPTTGDVQSLNVSNAVAVTLYAYKLANPA